MGAAEEERLGRESIAHYEARLRASTRELLLKRENRRLGLDDDAEVQEPVPGLELSAASEDAHLGLPAASEHRQSLDDMRWEGAAAQHAGRDAALRVGQKTADGLRSCVLSTDELIRGMHTASPKPKPGSSHLR